MDLSDLNNQSLGAVIRELVGAKLFPILERLEAIEKRGQQGQAANTGPLIKHMQVLDRIVKRDLSREIEELRERDKTQHRLILESDMKIHRLTKELAALRQALGK